MKWEKDNGRPTAAGGKRALAREPTKREPGTESKAIEDGHERSVRMSSSGTVYAYSSYPSRSNSSAMGGAAVSIISSTVISWSV